MRKIKLLKNLNFQNAYPELLKFANKEAIDICFNMVTGDSFSSGYVEEDIGISEYDAGRICEILLSHKCVSSHIENIAGNPTEIYTVI